MVLYFKCCKTNGTSVGNFRGFCADEAAAKGFSKIVRKDELSNGDCINFTMTCNDNRNKNHYYYEGKREHGVNIVELKIVFTTKVFIVDYVMECSEFDDDNYCVVGDDTVSDIDISSFCEVLLQM